MNDQIILSCLLAFAGLAAHVAAKWGEHREADPQCGLVEYLGRIAPAKSLLAALSAATVVGALYGMEWLNPAAGALTGWTANSALDNFQKRVMDQ